MGVPVGGSERQGDDGDEEKKTQREPKEGHILVDTRAINRHGFSPRLTRELPSETNSLVTNVADLWKFPLAAQARRAQVSCGSGNLLSVHNELDVSGVEDQHISSHTQR